MTANRKLLQLVGRCFALRDIFPNPCLLWRTRLYSLDYLLKKKPDGMRKTLMRRDEAATAQAGNN